MFYVKHLCMAARQQPGAQKAPPKGSASAFEWWSEGDLNPRHADFQSAALPTELPDHMCLPFAENPFEQTQDSILWQMAKRVNSFFQSIEAIMTPTRIAGANGNVWEAIPFPPRERDASASQGRRGMPRTGTTAPAPSPGTVRPPQAT